MAYTHSKYEVMMVPYHATALATTRVAGNVLGYATGLTGSWGPGYVPHLIRGAAVMPTVTTAYTNAALFNFEADISTPGTATTCFTIAVPTTRTGHTAVYYKPTYDIEIKPGSLIELRVTAIPAAGGGAFVTLYVEPRWDDPSNVTSMTQTT